MGEAWELQRTFDGCFARSEDLVGRKLIDLPHVLGFDPFMARECGAIYGIGPFDRGLLPWITRGWNNDRVTPESFNRPSLMAGQANRPLADTADIEAELESLFHRGLKLVKVQFGPFYQRTLTERMVQNIANRRNLTDAHFEQKYPNGAGIREYIFHKPVRAELLWSFPAQSHFTTIPAL